jgi:hypothetical protein
MSEAGDTMAVYKNAGWHALDAKPGGPKSLRIKFDLESRMEASQKGVGLGAFLIEVDGNDGESLRLILLLHSFHPGEGLAAWGAPGGPEIKVDDSSVQSTEVAYLSPVRGQPEGTGKYAEQTQIPHDSHWRTPHGILAIGRLIASPFCGIQQSILRAHGYCTLRCKVTVRNLG